ncbi:MAG: hypothetical protein ACYTBJ_04470 [Planctomycetota bacterium]|jgi:hypothetical protein
MGKTQLKNVVKKKLPYRRLWQARLLGKRIGRDAIPVDISLFRKIKGNIGLHGYRRVRKEDRENTRAYRKDSYGTTLVLLNLGESTIEARTETWGGLMAICSDFDLRSYRSC